MRYVAIRMASKKGLANRCKYVRLTVALRDTYLGRDDYQLNLRRRGVWLVVV